MANMANIANMVINALRTRYTEPGQPVSALTRYCVVLAKALSPL